MLVDLQAHRCPNAQVLMRRALDVFADSALVAMTLISIEPAMQRSIIGRLSVMDEGLSLMSVSSRLITENDVKGWVEGFDEEDYQDVTEVWSFVISKGKSNSDLSMD